MYCSTWDLLVVAYELLQHVGPIVPLPWIEPGLPPLGA